MKTIKIVRAIAGFVTFAGFIYALCTAGVSSYNPLIDSYQVTKQFIIAVILIVSGFCIFNWADNLIFKDRIRRYYRRYLRRKAHEKEGY